MKSNISKFAHLDNIIQIMPPLPLWPDQSIPYSDFNPISEWCIQFCDITPEDFPSFKNRAIGKKFITFDPETRLWTGRLYPLAVRIVQASV
jgi:hypothetical protein